MDQISYPLNFRKVGGMLVLIVPIGVQRAFKIRESDLGVPCTIKMSKDEIARGMNDEVFGNKHLVFKIYRTKDGEVFEGIG